MKNKRLLVAMSVLIHLCSCGDSPLPQTLQMADSLANVCPDSSLVVLEQFADSVSVTSESTRMYYQLLTVKVRDKAYILHTSDSLILPVVNYYEQNKDRNHLPEAYYYAGRVYRDMEDAPQALDYFQKALDELKDGENYTLLGRTYGQMGTLLLYQDLYDAAMNAFKRACHYSELTKDTSGLIYNMRSQGRAFCGKNETDSTLYYYQRAMQTAQQMGDSSLVSVIHQEMIGIYVQLKRYKEAKEFLRSSLRTIRNNPAPYYAAFADFYYAVEQLDSAQYYYHKLLTVGNAYHKHSGYEGLSRIARMRGESVEALQWMDQSIAYADSIRKIENTETICKMQSLYNYQLREKENNRLKEEAKDHRTVIKTLATGLAFICFIIITSILIYRLKRKQEQQRVKLQAEKLEWLKKEQHQNSLQRVPENEVRIRELEMLLRKTENQKNTLELSIQKAEKDLLELDNQYIKVRQNRQSLSESMLKKSPIYLNFQHWAESREEAVSLTNETWHSLAEVVDRTYDDFTNRLKELCPGISEHEIHICLLIKISISPAGMARMTNRSKQAITSVRKKLYEKVHNQVGSPEEWDRFVRNF